LSRRKLYPPSWLSLSRRCPGVESPNVTPDELRDFLTRRQVQFDQRAVQYGAQFRCPNGEIFTVFESGKLLVQGRRTALSDAVQALASSGLVEVLTEPEPGDAAQPVPRVPSEERRVFIVYGHDIAARDQLELLLRRMGLEPIVLQNVPAAGDTIIEKLERYLGEHGNVGFACVLLTPDDEGYAAGKPESVRYRARQNVVLELGMVLARIGRRRVAILYKESVEQPSDIAGLIYIPFTERVDEVKTQLFRELQAAGYAPRADAL
jgi:predicted nucleotide-binding protein